MKLPRIASAATLAVALVTSSAFAQNAAPQGPVPPAPLPPLPLNGLTVKVAQGDVQGALANGVAIFRGLPFAAPPVGDLRWRAPAPPLKWSGVRAANVFGSGCGQVEDCLFLNVYQPADAGKSARLPVMLYIHGGGFVGGSGAGIDGSQFARQGVVLVTVNYRLGRAGWFAHPALTAENPKGPLGNYGLMDQIAALQWVRDNIAVFGGDAKNVTVFGGSAGAISVNYLMLASQARGLFHKGISESGFGRIEALPLHTKDGSRSAEKIGAAFAESAGIKGSDAAAAKALRALSLADLTKAVSGVGSPDQPRPMADGRMILANTYEGFAKGREARMPYMLGGNSDEASLTRRGTNVAERFAAIKEPRDEFLSIFDPKRSGDTERIVARLITDQTISEPNRALARFHSKNGSPTYLYHFSYVPVAQRATAFGLGHGAETSYVFNMPRGGGTFDEAGKAVAVAANSYWVAFAKTGAPSSAGGTEWPRFDLRNEAQLEFPMDGVPVVQQHFDAARLDWVEHDLSK